MPKNYDYVSYRPVQAIGCRVEHVEFDQGKNTVMKVTLRFHTSPKQRQRRRNDFSSRRVDSFISFPV